MAKSRLSEVIDQLAFGKTTPKAAPCLGLYLSPEVIYIAETHLQGGRVAVDHLIRIPVPAPEKPATPTTSRESLTTEFLADHAKVAALIRQSMGAIRWNSKEVVVTLSHHLALLRYFTMPAIDRRYWNNAVPLEAKKYIPIPFDSLSHDFQIVPLPPDANNRPRQAALICVAQKQTISAVSSLLTALGLTMIGLEVAPCSVLRMWECLDKDRAGRAHSQVHFDGGNIRILVADHGVPVLFRDLFLGKEAQVSDLRKLDLPGCVAFSQKQLAVGQMQQVLVSGAGTSLSDWQQALSQEMGLPVAVQNTAQRVGIKSGDWGGYSAIGASLRQIAPGASTIDLGQVGRVSEDERRTARDVFTVAALVALFFALVGIYRTLACQSLARQLASLSSDADVQAAFANRSQGEIDAMMGTLKEQARAFAGISNPVKPTALISDIVAALPEEAWITSMRVRYPLLKSGQESLEIELGGRAMAATMAGEQDVAFQFRDRLLKAPSLAKHFTDIQVSVSGRPEGQAQGGDPESSRRAAEERTTFTMTMKKTI